MSKLVSVKIEFTIEVEDELFENYDAENDVDQVIDGIPSMTRRCDAEFVVLYVK